MTPFFIFRCLNLFFSSTNISYALYFQLNKKIHQIPQYIVDNYGIHTFSCIFYLYKK